MKVLIKYRSGRLEQADLLGANPVRISKSRKYGAEMMSMNPKKEISDSEIVEQAERIERRQYYDYVKDMAKEALEEHPDDEDAQEDQLHQSVDGSGYVIYTHKNLKVIRFTEHGDALWEEGMGDEMEKPESEGDVLQKLAYWDMLADARDELQRLREEKESER